MGIADRFQASSCMFILTSTMVVVCRHLSSPLSLLVFFFFLSFFLSAAAAAEAKPQAAGGAAGGRGPVQLDFVACLHDTPEYRSALAAAESEVLAREARLSNVARSCRLMVERVGGTMIALLNRPCPLLA